jgi:hypothetical protein
MGLFLGFNGVVPWISVIEALRPGDSRQAIQRHRCRIGRHRSEGGVPPEFVPACSVITTTETETVAPEWPFKIKLRKPIVGADGELKELSLRERVLCMARPTGLIALFRWPEVLRETAYRFQGLLGW